MSDYMIKVLSPEANAIGLACVTTRLVDEARKIHRTSATASAALGRALTGGLLLGGLVKEGQRVGLKFEGNGPMQKIIVEADNEGKARGFVGDPLVEVPLKGNKLNVAGALGTDGLLTVYKDSGKEEPYRGIVRFRTGEVAEDIAHYLAESEQIPSAVALGVFVEASGRVTAAGGFLVQALPPSDDHMIGRLIGNIREMQPVTEMVRKGVSPEQMLDSIFSGVNLCRLDRRELSLECTCNWGRIERVLMSLGCEELLKMAAEQEQTEVLCEFCGTTYRFSKEEIRKMSEQCK